MPPQFRSRYLSEIAVLNGVINATGKAQLEGLSIVMSLEKNADDYLPIWKTQCSANNPKLQKQCTEIFKSH
ncbi:hypothetical protein AB8849_04955 [Proteus vulgaris]